MVNNKEKQRMSNRTRYLLAAVLICSAVLIGIAAPVKATSVRFHAVGLPYDATGLTIAGYNPDSITSTYLITPVNGAGPSEGSTFFRIPQGYSSTITGNWLADSNFSFKSPTPSIEVSFNTGIKKVYDYQYSYTTTSVSTGVITVNAMYGEHAQPGNQKPVVDAGADAAIDEGDLFTQPGSFTDPDSATWTATVDYGDGDGPQDLKLDGKSFTLNHPYSQDGKYFIKVVVNDTKAEGESLTTVTVANVAPDVNAGDDTTIDEGDTFTRSGSFKDPGADKWKANVSYGDGSLVELDLTPEKTFSLSHTYMDNGVYPVTVNVTDGNGDGDNGIATFDVTVNNVAPTVIPAIAVPTDPVRVGSPVSTSASFTDPGVLDTPHTAIWIWDDGSTSDGIVTETEGTGTGSVSGSHTFSAAGIYTVKVSVTDKDGDISSELSASTTIVVYDPSAGFATGGGWFNSPAGAYTADPTKTGKANFAFVSKYKKDATTPESSAKFQFKAGNVDFESTAYDWLVISGSNAIYQGAGTVNGAGNYGFQLSAVDGSPDTIGIKIWEKKEGNPVMYDNQMTSIGGGSIVVHV